MMQRVVAIKQPGSFTASDRVVLDADDRQRRRIVLTGEKGTRLLLDLDEPVSCATAMGWCSTTARSCWSRGRRSRWSRSSAKAPLDLVRLAWHIGNRHTDVQFVDKASASGAIMCWRRW